MAEPSPIADPTLDPHERVQRTLNRTVFLPLALMAALGLLMYWQISRLMELTAWVDHTDRVIAVGRLVERLSIDQETGVRGFGVNGDEIFLEPYTRAREVLPRRLRELESLVADSADQRERAQGIHDLIDRWHETYAAPAIATRRGGAVWPTEHGRRGKVLMDQLRERLATFVSHEESLRDGRVSAAQGAARTTFLAGSALAAALAAVLAFFTRRQMLFVSGAFAEALDHSKKQTRELEASRAELAARGDELLETAKAETKRREELSAAVAVYGAFIDRLAQGDLTAQVEPTGPDALRTLGENLRTMARALRTMTLRVNESIAGLSTATADIIATTQQLGAGAAQSATAVTETVATVDEFSQAAQQTSERAKGVAAAAQKSEEVSASGLRAVEQTVQTMNRVREQVSAGAERTLALSEQAQAVGQIITAVNELAEQSNLLALNAAIEAARAGEQGRGFSVVAREMRALAEQSKRATGEVRTILNDIQKSTTAAVLAAEESGKAVAVAVEAAQQAGERIEQLAATITTAANAATDIAVATQQQVTGVGHIAQAMRSIDQATTQTLQGTRQSQRASAELDRLGSRLRDAVAQYRT